MSTFSDRILDALELAIDEREELLARRAAESRQLVLECRAIDRAEMHGDDYEVHLIEPRSWRCIAVRRSWAQMRRLVEDMRPVVVRRFLEQAKPCALHPTPRSEV